jgi:hypothetical protein
MSDSRAFTYQELAINATSQTITCRYSVAGEEFVERVTIPGADLDLPGVREAATWYFLLAGVSYFKSSVPPIIDLGVVATSQAEQDFLLQFYREGLGEFAHKNALDLTHLTLIGPTLEPTKVETGLSDGNVLIPFGGGIDSIVTVSELAGLADRAALFVAERPGARFEAIERPAAVTNLPIQRAERLIDAKLLESASRGYLNGHVPVTGILSALAVLTAVSSGYGAVAMSNERSASSATIESDQGSVNHQWSKGLAFEQGFRSVLSKRLGGVEYFSFLRNRSELDIARQFAKLDRFHGSFRSCNRSFHQDPARRLDAWCGICDKCLFVDLILAPFMDRSQLDQIFAGAEPLESPALAAQLEVLVGVGAGERPFECVGDEAECREALLLTAQRDDRQGSTMIRDIASRIPRERPEAHELDIDFIPERYATPPRLD